MAIERDKTDSKARFLVGTSVGANMYADAVVLVDASGNPIGGGTSSTPSIAGGEYNSSAPTLTNGQTDALQLDSKGTLRIAPVSSNGATQAEVLTTGSDGRVASAGLIVASFSHRSNGSTWDRDKKPNLTSRLVSAAATTNATVAKASAGDLFKIMGYNAAAAARYLKLYNIATSPVVGTTAIVQTIRLPATAAFEVNFSTPAYFSAGISYAFTVNSGDADTTALTSADITDLTLWMA